MVYDCIVGSTTWRRLAVLSFSLIFLVGCASPAVSPTTGQTAGPTVAATASPLPTGGTLIFARNAEPASLNPLGISDNGSIWTVMQIFDQLVELRPGSADPQPGLASSWEISPDGLTYTFHLRAAKFSNGDPVTAEDVKYSLDRFTNPDINTEYPQMAGAVGSISIVDPSTIKVVLTRVDGLFFNALSLFIASIVPKKVVEAIGEKAFGEAPIGSGPFMLKSWTRGQSVELVKNPNYWQEGKPYLDGVTFVFIQDDNARILKVENNEAQVAEAIPVSQVARLKAEAGITVLVEPLAGIVGAYLNNVIKPLDDKNIRQALNYATPKQAILDTVWMGNARIANGMIPAVKYWDSTIPPYPYDLDKAKSLMAASSSPNGFTLPMNIVGGDVISQQTAAILQAEWAKIGVKVEITTLDLGTLLTKHRASDFTAELFPANVITSDVLVDDELAANQLDITAGKNSFRTGYNSPEASRLVQTANTSPDEATRKSLFSQLQKLTLDDAPWVPLLYTPAITAVRSSVIGFQTLETGWWMLQDVRLAP